MSEKYKIDSRNYLYRSYANNENVKLLESVHPRNEKLLKPQKQNKSYLEVQNRLIRSGVDPSVKQLEAVSRQFVALNLERNHASPKENRPFANNQSCSCPRLQNFRELSLYPTPEDINRRQLAFLRPNKIIGAYDNVEHYLDVQFRLLREDFVASVRKGLQLYANMDANKRRATQFAPPFKLDGVRLYPNTKFGRIRNSHNNKLGVEVNFDSSGALKNERWKESKRFMFGSLLLFPFCCDLSSFFCATVVGRDASALKAGEVLVSLVEDADVSICKCYVGRSCTMVECEAFFELYFHLMKLLKGLDESSFPMRRYIVEGAVSPTLPKYVRDVDMLKVCNRLIAPFTDASSLWPTAAELGLDAFQYHAFKAALTREFCVIQGPPGTGKTFIGLKIVENVWHNAKTLSRRLRLPILVVCAANHALDQFLEGILKFTTNVIRMGGRSRSEILKKYNLRERVMATKRFSQDKQLRDEMRSYQQQIDRISVKMKCIEVSSGILRVSLLREVVGPEYQFVVKDDSQLHKWLLRGCQNNDERHFTESDFKKFFLADGELLGPGKHQNSEEIIEETDDEDVDDDDVEGTDDAVDDTFKRDQIALQLELENCYSISLGQLKTNCERLLETYWLLKKKEKTILPPARGCTSICDSIKNCRTKIERCMRLYDVLKENLTHRPILEIVVNLELVKEPVVDPLKHRWRLYWSWLSKLRDGLSKQLMKLEKLLTKCVELYEKGRLQRDLELLQNADIVGMTTSGAARWNGLLKSLHPAVVVIEEAGEVQETHVVASLTKECQHVILIGDHEQLKPVTAVYELSKDYDMNVSLFERMVKNGMDCPVLNVQHRMRPEISCLISPLIYPNLKNHNSVMNFESIRGISKNIFFIEHSVFEDTTARNVTSKQNQHEAKFVVMLAKYLTQQDYDPKNITILTTYAAQRFLILNFKRRYSLDKDVKCVVVDKYQGEENDIVLLSLVRSNVNGAIGFLNIKNRVCVALSRAKKGFYIIGNMDCLTAKCQLWRHIKETLMKEDAIGRKLQLQCGDHNKFFYVASAEDFDQLKCGGCGSRCNVRLKCGHYCTSFCRHPANKDHLSTSMRCAAKCEKSCWQCKKLCPKACWEVCEPCSYQILKTIPQCGHKVILMCSTRPKPWHCEQRCYNLHTIRNIYEPRNSYDTSSSIRSYDVVPSLPERRRSCSYDLNGYCGSNNLESRESYFSFCSLL